MFQQNYKKELDRISPSPELSSALLKKLESAPAKLKPIRRRVVFSAAAVFLVVLTAALLLLPKYTVVIKAGNYMRVYSALQSAAKKNNQYFYNGDYELLVTEDTAATVEIQTPSSSKNEHSETNTQVGGVDEADTVKTDGNYIYTLFGNTLKIYRADAENTGCLSTVVLPASTEDESVTPLEFYVSGDRLLLLCQSYLKSRSSSSAPELWFMGKNRTSVLVYDLSDRTAPRLLSETGQDGNYISSRLTEGFLYLVTETTLYSEPELSDLSTFIPSLWENGTSKLISEEDICIPSGFSSAQYLTVSSYAETSGIRIDTKCVLGGNSFIYMNTKNLYVACPCWEEQETKTQQADGTTTNSYDWNTSTNLLRFAVSSGKIDLAASGNVDGQLLNQFSMDEYNGYFRLVTTISNYSSSTSTDGSVSNETRGKYSLLCVLDSSLAVVGQTSPVGEDESVYSVRFDGDVGYFVTFRTTDPLFAVDLHDPYEPKVMSALKIPGFSQYLHPYSSGLLFGLGYDADPDTGFVSTMKLSMFDTSDPYHVTEVHTLRISAYWSQALYNHKAILIDSDRELIAFPTENAYLIYGYSAEKGFYEKGTVSDDSCTARGLYIGDYFYVCTETGVKVYRLSDFSNVLLLS